MSNGILKANAPFAVCWPFVFRLWRPHFSSTSLHLPPHIHLKLYHSELKDLTSSAPMGVNGGTPAFGGQLNGQFKMELLNEEFQALDFVLHRGTPLAREELSDIMQRCSKTQDLTAGRRLHSLMIAGALDLLDTSSDQLIRLFASCGCLLEANLVFCMHAQPSVFTWHAIMSAHVMLAECRGALGLYQKMQEDGVRAGKFIFACILKACGIIGAKEEGKMMHVQIVTSRLESDTVIGSTLISMYAKCGSLSDARKVFDELPCRNVVSWGTMIAGYAQRGHGLSALELLEKMQQEGIKPDKVMYMSILKACGSIVAIRQGQMLHSQIVRNEFALDMNIGSALVDMYAKCGRVEEARRVFDFLPMRNEVSWCAMIAGYAQHGNRLPAVELFQRMQQEGIRPGKVAFLCILKACSNIGEVELGMVIHDHIIRSGLNAELAVGSTLVDMYAKCGSLEEAWKLFERLTDRNVVSWGAMITGYAQNGYGLLALGLFEKMQQEGIKADRVTFLSVLKVCGSVGAMGEGYLIHEQVIRSYFETDLVIGSTLIDMYAKCGTLEDAYNVLDKLTNRNAVSWGAMIAGLVQHGHNLWALDIFAKMQEEAIRPDKVAFSCILKACGSKGDIECGKLIHEHIIRARLESEVVVGNALVDMYAKCRALCEAVKLFDKLPNQNAASWNAMITGYAEHGHDLTAFDLYEKMCKGGMEPDRVTFMCILKACGSSGAVEQGMFIHDQVIRSGLETDVVIASTLVDMYAKCECIVEAQIVFEKLPNRNAVSWNAMIAGYVNCGDLEEARKLFDDLPGRNVISWNSMLAGYVQHGYGLSALELFATMEQEGIMPDKVTFLSILKACGSVGATGKGRLLHAQIIRSGLESDVFIGNTLIDMYADCGRVEEAYDVFDKLPNRDVASWSAMIAALAEHGSPILAGQFFTDMQKQGLKPGGMVYTSVLAACSHTVQVDEGHTHYKSLIEDRRIEPSVEHFNCMVDLLGRSGCLDEAKDILQTMPIPPDMTGWMSLLIACRTHKNVKLGRLCFDQAVQLDSNIASGYVLLSNIYADAQMWEEFHEIQGLRKSSSSLKKAGRAWIEVKNTAHEFIVAGKTHSQSNKIYAKLHRLRRLIKEKEYMPQLNLVLE